MATRKFDLAITIALVPVLGTGLVLMNQLGRYLYYGVPQRCWSWTLTKC